MKTLKLTFVLLVLSFSSVFAQYNYFVEGVVTDSATSDPIPNKYVFLFVNSHFQDSTVTDSNGWYSLNYTHNDDTTFYEVSTFDCHSSKISQSGHHISHDTLKIHDFSICHGTQQYSITIDGYARNSGNPMANQWVYIKSNHPPIFDSVLTDTSGYYVFQINTTAFSGQFDIYTHCNGFVASDRINYDAHNTQFSVDLDCTLQQISLSFSGHVTDSNNHPIGHHWVYIKSNHLSIFDSVLTDSNGYYEFQFNVPPGSGQILLYTSCNGHNINHIVNYSAQNNQHTIDFNCGKSTTITHNIHGTIYLDSAGQLGSNVATVYLVKFDSLHNILIVVDSTHTDSHGRYYFLNVSKGNYLVKAALQSNSPDYNDYMPTYHLRQLNWSNANYVNVSTDSMYFANIQMIPGNNPGGPGFIGGNVYHGANKKDEEPIEGVLVFLLTANDDPVAYTYTNNEGRYEFNNIEYGTYKVYAEVINLPTFPPYVTISANEPEVDDLILTVNSSGVFTGLKAVPKNDFVSQLYPNPARNELHLSFKFNLTADVKLTIFDLTGRKVLLETQNILNADNKMTINIENLAVGLYLLEVQSGNLISTMQFIKE